MSVYDEGFDKIIDKALNILFAESVDVYSFAFYYDHESHSLEVLVDTKVNSKQKSYHSNKFSTEEFLKAIHSKDLEKASRWSRVAERNYALGDFKYKSLGWEAIKVPNNSDPFFLAMVRAVVRNSKKISALSRSPEDLVYICSSKDDEAGFIWRNSVD